MVEGPNISGHQCVNISLNLLLKCHLNIQNQFVSHLGLLIISVIDLIVTAFISDCWSCCFSLVFVFSMRSKMVIKLY